MVSLYGNQHRQLWLADHARRELLLPPHPLSSIWHLLTRKARELVHFLFGNHSVLSAPSCSQVQPPAIARTRGKAAAAISFFSLQGKTWGFCKGESGVVKAPSLNSTFMRFERGFFVCLKKLFVFFLSALCFEAF